MEECLLCCGPDSSFSCSPLSLSLELSLCLLSTLPIQMNGHAFTKFPAPPPVVPASQFPTVPPSHFTREGGGVTPSSYAPLTSKKMGGSYADMYLTKLQRGTAVPTKPVYPPPGYSRKGSLKGTENSAFFVNRAPMPPHATIPPPITSKRHLSLPEGFLPPSSISESLDQHRSEVVTAEGHRLHEPHYDITGASMSVSWPRSRGSLPVNLLRGSQQISPNVSAMVGGGEGVICSVCPLYETRNQDCLHPFILSPSFLFFPLLSIYLHLQYMAQSRQACLVRSQNLESATRSLRSSSNINAVPRTARP